MCNTTGRHKLSCDDCRRRRTRSRYLLITTREGTRARYDGVTRGGTSLFIYLLVYATKRRPGPEISLSPLLPLSVPLFPRSLFDSQPNRRQSKVRFKTLVRKMRRRGCACVSDARRKAHLTHAVGGHTNPFCIIRRFSLPPSDCVCLCLPPLFPLLSRFSRLCLFVSLNQTLIISSCR